MGISSTPKNIRFFCHAKIFSFCTFTLRKDPKYIEETPKTSPISSWPPPLPKKKKKNIHKIFIPPPPPQKKKKINISDPPPPSQKKKNIIQKFKQKIAPILRMYQTVSEYLPPPPPPPPCGPWSLCGCNLAMECQQIYQNAKIFSSTRPDAWSYLRFVPFSRSEILETIPSILKLHTL